MSREIENIVITPIFHRTHVIKKHHGHIDRGFGYATFLDADGRSVYQGLVPSGHNIYSDGTERFRTSDKSLQEMPIVVDKATVSMWATGDSLHHKAGK